MFIFEVLPLKISVTWLHLSLQVFTRKISSEINVETLNSFETRLGSFKNCLTLKFRNLHLAYLHPFMLRIFMLRNLPTRIYIY